MEFATGHSPKIESLPKKSLKINKENLNAIPFHASPLNQSESSTYTQLDPIFNIAFWLYSSQREKGWRVVVVVVASAFLVNFVM